jgi:hypothetical protein
MRQYPTVDVVEAKIAICGQSIPVSPKGWGSEKEKKGFAVNVLFTHTLEIPAGHGREIDWSDASTLEFIPEPIGDQVHAAYGIVAASQTMFMVCVANFGTVPVTLEEGCVVGHLEGAKTVSWVQSLSVGLDPRVGSEGTQVGSEGNRVGSRRGSTSSGSSQPLRHPSFSDWGISSQFSIN